jgi:hypothetical protein
MMHSKKWSWLKAWAMQIARRRGMKKAIVALARRLALEVCVRRPRCPPRHHHGAGIRKPSHKRSFPHHPLSNHTTAVMPVCYDEHASGLEPPVGLPACGKLAWMFDRTSIEQDTGRGHVLPSGFCFRRAPLAVLNTNKGEDMEDIGKEVENIASAYVGSFNRQDAAGIAERNPGSILQERREPAPVVLAATRAKPDQILMWAAMRGGRATVGEPRKNDDLERTRDQKRRSNS